MTKLATRISEKIRRILIKFPAKWYFNRQFKKAFTADYDRFWVVDIDNTISNTWVKCTPQYAEAYASPSERMLSFEPFESMQLLFRNVPPRTRLIFLSARQYIRYGLTKKWLVQHGFWQNDSVIVLVEKMRDKVPLLESVLAGYFSKNPPPQYIAQNSAIDERIKPEMLAHYLMSNTPLNGNYPLVYFDDLSYNHENGEVLYYEPVIEAVKKMPIQYIGYPELLVMQGIKM